MVSGESSVRIARPISGRFWVRSSLAPHRNMPCYWTILFPLPNISFVSGEVTSIGRRLPRKAKTVRGPRSLLGPLDTTMTVYMNMFKKHPGDVTRLVMEVPS